MDEHPQAAAHREPGVDERQGGRGREGVRDHFPVARRADPVEELRHGRGLEWPAAAYRERRDVGPSVPGRDPDDAAAISERLRLHENRKRTDATGARRGWLPSCDAAGRDRSALGRARSRPRAPGAPGPARGRPRRIAGRRAGRGDARAPRPTGDARRAGAGPRRRLPRSARGVLRPRRRRPRPRHGRVRRHPGTPRSWPRARDWPRSRRLEQGAGTAAFCAVRPPGHHAEPTHAMGFCLINNVAVAAAELRATAATEVLIVDWDAHHGNGTQDMFWADPDVMYVSLHEWPLYPGTGRLDDTGAGAGRGRDRQLPLARPVRRATSTSPRSTPSSRRSPSSSRRIGCSSRPGSTPTGPTRSPASGSSRAISPIWPPGCRQFGSARSHGRVPRGRLRPRRPPGLRRRHRVRPGRRDATARTGHGRRPRRGDRPGRPGPPRPRRTRRLAHRSVDSRSSGAASPADQISVREVVVPCWTSTNC